MNVQKVTPEAKAAALARVMDGGERPVDVAADMADQGIVAGTLRRWKTEEIARSRESGPSETALAVVPPAEAEPASDGDGEVTDAELVEEDAAWEMDESPFAGEAEEWELVRFALAESARLNLELGRRLIRLRAHVSRERPGDWENTVKRELHMSPQKASSYMRLARSPAIREVLNTAPERLPRSLRAALVVATMTREEARLAIKLDLGESTTEKEAETLRAKVSPPPEVKADAGSASEDEPEREGAGAAEPVGRLCGAGMHLLLDALEKAMQAGERMDGEDLLRQANQYGQGHLVGDRLDDYSDWLAGLAGRLRALLDALEGDDDGDGDES